MISADPPGTRSVRSVESERYRRLANSVISLGSRSSSDAMYGDVPLLPSKNARGTSRSGEDQTSRMRRSTYSSRTRSIWLRDSAGAASASARALCACCQRNGGTRIVIHVVSGCTSTVTVPPAFVIA